ncbi:putative secreted protein [Estrella lausannensis]|uniref:Putative secreted protein n=2 Tax=Estrella lausannensis TaxID=483423 RepID=A0A0H5DS94_9BACT|nr:putative secreted protein [Estrella lausannensis]
MMKCFFTIALMIITASLPAWEVECLGCRCHNSDSTDKFLVGRVVLQPENINRFCATSFLLEGSQDLFRGSGTIGLDLSADDRMKVTGEWLSQNSSFNFCSGTKKRWIHQWAAGFAYQHLFCNPYILSFDAGVCYSHAFGRSLGTKACSTQSDVKRYIAGAKAFDATLGATFFSFCDGVLSLFATYDKVEYKKKYFEDKEEKGFGGGVKLVQPVIPCVDLVVGAEVRQPYNYYNAELNWVSELFCYDYTLGLFGAYTQGKGGLCNDGRLGVQIAVNLGSTNCRERAASCGNGSGRSVIGRALDFNNWVMTPAVYRPKVLAVKDQDCVITCVAPQAVGTTFDILGIEGEINTFEGYEALMGSNLSFSLTGSVPSGVTVDQTTGVMIVPPTLEAGEYNFTLRGVNQCGSATTPVFLVIVRVG